MKRIVIFQDMPLFPYRIYAYNELAKRGYDLTVVSVSNTEGKYDIPKSFNTINLKVRDVGPFRKLYGIESIDIDSFDIIIVDPNLRILDYYRFYRDKYWNKLIGWGHHKGRTSGNKLAEWFRFRFFKKFRALVFYEAETREEYIKHGFNPNRLFVANNTQYVNLETVKLEGNRCFFTYVGRIQERKRIDLALRAFAIIKGKLIIPNIKFLIVGGGDVSSLQELVRDLSIEDEVIFTGAVHDENKLGDYFNQTIAYVSPGHVGLGVLHSLAFGVPVITCKDRLHSLEIVNCKPDNSFLVGFDSHSIAEAMERLISDGNLRKQMSLNAFNYYRENCTIDKMVDGVDNAIKYISKL